MDHLKELIKTLNNTEYKELTAYIKNKNKRLDTKNIQLLKLLYNDDINIEKSIYNNEKYNKASYHSLRKRLYKTILEFIGNNAHDKPNLIEQETVVNLKLAQILFLKNIPHLAFKHLVKAQVSAQKFHLYHHLRNIYLMQLHYAHLNEFVDINNMANLVLENESKLNNESRIEIAYAYLRSELSSSQRQKKIINISNLIKHTLNKFNIKIDIDLEPKYIYQILYIANEYAAIYQDFSLIDKYIQYINFKINISISDYDYYLGHIYYYITNYYIRIGEWNNAKLSLLQYEKAIRNNPFKHYFSLSYNLLAALYHFYTGKKEKSIKIAEEILHIKAPKNLIIDKQDIKLSLAIFYSFSKDANSIKYLGQLWETDAYYEKDYGIIWTIRKNIIEILIHLQFNNEDVFLSRLKSFKRRYKKYLIDTNELKVLDFICVVEKYVKAKNSNDIVKIKEVLNVMMLSTKYKDVYNKSFVVWFYAYVNKVDNYQLLLKHI
jgi:hypothetical protein